jgi:ABC-type glutathione transport system ATPase component
MNQVPILTLNQVSKTYLKTIGHKTSQIQVLNQISLNVFPGKTLGIVGESGSGKSTLAKILMNLEPPDSGTIFSNIQNELVPHQKLKGKELAQHIQMVFQDTAGALNPLKKAWELVAAPLLIHTSLTRLECKERAIESLNRVGISRLASESYPYQLSGGQRQRIGIARATILKPRILILDEPVSALDASVQAQVLNLLMDLQDQFGLTYLFISHDLSVIRHLSDSTLMIHQGNLLTSENLS